tara:strand:+ start:75 stop:647 length:573 start_codon:yes stop_codon:yes gene_type:complete
MGTANLQRYLNSFGEEVVGQARKNLRTAGKGGGKLDKSIKYKVLPDGDGFTVQFFMADYGTFVDKGVKGAGGTIENGKYEGTWGGRRWFINYEGKRQDSPYKYGTGTGAKGGLSRGIGSFIKKKGIQPRKGGKYASTKGLKYLIIRNIWIRGIHGISFFQNSLMLGMRDFSSGVAKAVAKDLADNLKPKN